jgi:RimJ/RimL family protein N-acetyltransferase
MSVKKVPIIEGWSYRLRPVAPQDAGFVFSLRTNPKINRFLHTIGADIDAQKKWIEDYLETPDDYYFVIERLPTQTAEGLIGLYNIDSARNCAEWGRWILTPESMAAMESTLLIYMFGFNTLRLDEVYCRTVALNEKVVSFHDSFGLARSRKLSGYFQIGESRVDAIEHRLKKGQFAHVQAQVQPLVERIANKINRRA